MKGQNGYAEYVATHRELAREEQPRTEPANYGSVQGDTLVVGGFTPFEPGMYGWLVHDNFLFDPFTTTNPTAVGDHGTHVHTVIRPAELLPRPQWPDGTVVLIVWILNRTYPVIVGRVAGLE